MPTIAVLNRSTVLADADLAPVIAALQIQVERDFAPAWSAQVALVQVAGNEPVPDGAWQLVVLDDSDQAGDLGYHELGPNGEPLGKVFARTDQQYGLSWSVTLSHELLEMLGDPDVERFADFRGPGGHEMQTAVEVCDPVEDDQFAYEIDGIRVSNFVLPSYFNGGAAPFDFRGLLTAGCPAMLSGGYMMVLDEASSQGWTQIYGQVSARDRARLDRPRGRLYRRTLPRDQWRRSLVSG